MGLSCLTRNQGFAISDLAFLPWFLPFLASSREALAWLVLKSLPCCRRCWPMCAVSNAHDLWCWWCCGLPGAVVPESGLWGRIRGSGRSPAYAITIELPKRQWQCPCEHRPAEAWGPRGLEQGRIRQFAGGSIVVMPSGHRLGPSLQQTTSDRNLDAASSPVAPPPGCS